MKVFKLNTLLFLGLLASCKSDLNRDSLIEGTWVTDSARMYYGPFSMSETDGVDFGSFRYDKEGMVHEMKHGSSISMRYTLEGDTLYLREISGILKAKYLIVDLNTRRMVLRKEKEGLFEDVASNRYEIRYYSKLKTQ